MSGVAAEVTWCDEGDEDDDIYAKEIRHLRSNARRDEHSLVRPLDGAANEGGAPPRAGRSLRG